MLSARLLEAAKPPTAHRPLWVPPFPPPFPNRSFPSCSVVKCDPLSLHILKWQVTVGLGKILGKIYKNSLSTKDSYTPWGPIFGNSASVFAKGAPPPQHAFTTLMARFLNPPSPSPHSPPQETKKKRRVSLLSSPTEGGRGDPSCRGGPSTNKRSARSSEGEPLGERERERERHEPHPDGGPAEGNSGCPPAGAVRSVGPRPPHQCVRLYPEGE